MEERRQVSPRPLRRDRISNHADRDGAYVERPCEGRLGCTNEGSGIAFRDAKGSPYRPGPRPWMIGKLALAQLVVTLVAGAISTSARAGSDDQVVVVGGEPSGPVLIVLRERLCNEDYAKELGELASSASASAGICNCAILRDPRGFPRVCSSTSSDDRRLCLRRRCRPGKSDGGTSPQTGYQRAYRVRALSGRRRASGRSIMRRHEFSIAANQIDGGVLAACVRDDAGVGNATSSAKVNLRRQLASQ